MADVNSRNLILATDSYKYSHYLQLPKNVRRMYSYIESRGGEYLFSRFFGLQAYIKEYLMAPIADKDIDEAEKIVETHIPGLKFNRTGWEYILKKYGGYMPVTIRAVVEGTDVPVSNVLVTVESFDDEVPWLVGHLETTILRGVWYPTTVATRSAHIKEVIRKYLKLTSDCTTAEEKLVWSLHDFGMRGTTSEESAGIAGASHLLNFFGTDTMDSLKWIDKYYGSPLAGFSIPASEHSTMTIWGRNTEIDAYENLFQQFGTKGLTYANVVDSYNTFEVCRNILPKFKDRLNETGATMVVRSDSGDPTRTIPEILEILDLRFGSTLNSKQYKTLNNVRVLQSDGVNLKSIKQICDAVVAKGFSAENIGFGCGDYLLQDLTRDTQRFAMKASCSKLDNGDWIDVFKDPETDNNKRSKRGRITLYKNRAGEYYSDVVREGQKDELQTVYTPGQLHVEDSFDDIRNRVGMLEY